MLRCPVSPRGTTSSRVSLIDPSVTSVHDSSELDRVSPLTTEIPAGGTNGIGLSISRTLFSRGARVTLIGGHRQQVGEQAVAYIRSGDLSAAPEDYAAGFGSQGDESGAVGEKNVLQEGEVEWVSVDLEDLKDVARVAKETVEKIEQTEQKRLDGVFFLAGKGVNEFSLTPDGYE